VTQFFKAPVVKRPESLDAQPPPSVSVEIKRKHPKSKLDSFFPKAVVIASSTGGPTALEKIFTGLTGPFKCPVLIAQHMPPVFTQILAKRLSEICQTDVIEARGGEVIKPGVFLVAPGDFHLYINKKNDEIQSHIDQAPLRNSVRPAADHLFESSSQIWGAHLLGIVLTGMGEDGAIGAKMIREKSGRILIQNKESCVVFGMPGAVFANDDYDEMGDLTRIQQLLKGFLQ
jgi:two-component system, chemotaxis family, protein-glutamate methylesterase/glutaminase